MHLLLEWNQIQIKLLSQRFSLSLSLSILVRTQNILINVLPHFMLIQEALRAYELVFDAVYTPRNTRLLQEAAEVGAIVVSGVEMFIRQALGQFRLFTGGLGTGLPIMSNHQFINLTRVFLFIYSKNKFYQDSSLLIIFCSNSRNINRNFACTAFQLQKISCASLFQNNSDTCNQAKNKFVNIYSLVISSAVLK